MISNTWPSILLGRVITDMQPGFARKPNVDDSGMPQLRTNNVSSDGKIDLSQVKYVDCSTTEFDKYSVVHNDVIFNNTNSPELVGRTACFEIGTNFVLSNHMTRLRVENKLILAPYLARYLHHLWASRYSKSRAKQWVNQAAIDQKELSRFQIPLPPLPEQERIVAILRQADELRALRRAADERAQELQAALFFEMFGPHLSKNGDSKKQKLNQLGEISYGLTVNRSRRQAGNEYPYLRVGNVYRWELQLSDIKTIGTLGNDIEKYTLQNGDVLVVEGHANPYALGRAAVWNNEIPNCLHQNHILRIRPFPGKCTPNFLAGYINSSVGQQFMLRYGKTSSGLNTINSTDLGKMRIECPPFDKQMEFEERNISYLKIMEHSKTIANKLDNLGQSILTRAFTGELTAEWRETHQEDLAAAAKQRDRILGLRPRVTRQVGVVEEIETTLVPFVPKPTHPRYHALRVLSKPQLLVYAAARKMPGYFTPGSLNTAYDLPLIDTRRTLPLLETIGLLVSVTLPDSPTGEGVVYFPAYRLPQERDDSRSEDMAALTNTTEGSRL